MPEQKYFDVDLRDVQGKIAMMRSMHTEKEANAMMYKAFKLTGQHVRAIMKKDVPRKYRVTATLVGRAVKNAKTTIDKGSVECLIPIRDVRGGIGTRYKSSSGLPGWASVYRKYRVRALIVKGARSVLPRTMDTMGGQKPFRNTTAEKLHGLAFTREGEGQLPIRPIYGVAIPQMPMNRAKEEAEADILEFLMEKIEHEHEYRLSKGR